MTLHHRQLLAAIVSGLFMVFVAGLMVQPAMAAGYYVEAEARVANLSEGSHLNLRKWPAAYSLKVGELAPRTEVWVERCVFVKESADWCRIHAGERAGWVNAGYLAITQRQ